MVPIEKIEAHSTVEMEDSCNCRSNCCIPSRKKCEHEKEAEKVSKAVRDSFDEMGK